MMETLTSSKDTLMNLDDTGGGWVGIIWGNESLLECTLSLLQEDHKLLFIWKLATLHQ